MNSNTSQPQSALERTRARISDALRTAQDASADVESIRAFDADTLDSISRDLTSALHELDKLTN